MNNKGKIWEIKACNYLRRRGYTLVDSNYKTRFGEIDLIMRRRGYICFIEVKQRDCSSVVRPAEFVDERKQAKIIASAKIFLMNYNRDLQPRFDVIEIYTDNNKIKSIKHLENAFDLV